jgi:hypothetical protein
VTRSKDLKKLEPLADLLLQHRLGQMRQANDRLARSRAQIAALDKAAEPAGLPEVVEALVACDYRRWADARKAELNEVIARQTAEAMAARAEAEMAFGRVHALRGIAAKLQGKR